MFAAYSQTSAVALSWWIQG